MKDKNIKQTTIDTYNNSAKELAEYFRGIGSRTKDVELAIKLSGSSSPAVLEIGCGDGRDAKEIIKRAGSYVGFDISKGLINIAKEFLPDAKFILSDALDFDYGREEYDIVFAFASLLHLSIDEVQEVFLKVHEGLKSNGVFSISLKLAKVYEEKIKKDKFGTRIFYYYNPEVIRKIAGQKFEVINVGGGFKTVGNTEWFEMVLRKR